MHAPPSPPVQKKPIPWLPILLILGVGFALVAGLCGYGFYVVSQMVKEPPKAKEGAGKPVVAKRLQEGWAQYKFPEGPFEMELPNEPEFAPIEFEKINSLAYRAWTAYEIESDYTDTWFAAYWYRSLEFVDLKAELESATYWFSEDQNVTEVKIRYSAKTVGDKKGQELSCTYTHEGVPWAVKAFAWSNGKIVYYLQTYYNPNDAKESEADFYRIIQSFQSG